MPLFKTVKIAVKGKNQDFRFNINGEGKFWCQSDLFTDHNGKVEAETYSEVENLVHDIIRKYNDAATIHEYFIHYRLHLSRQLKASFTKIDTVGKLSEELWNKTNGVGNEYLSHDVTGFILEWHPLVKTTCGSHFQMKRLKVAEQSDFDYVESYGELFIRDLHYPFGDKELAMIVTKDFYSFQGGELYFELPLTKETLAFFTNTEKSLAEVIGKFLLFISQDSAQLMASITKELGEGNQKFLLLGEASKENNTQI